MLSSDITLFTPFVDPDNITLLDPFTAAIDTSPPNRNSPINPSIASLEDRTAIMLPTQDTLSCIKRPRAQTIFQRHHATDHRSTRLWTTTALGPTPRDNNAEAETPI
jgi:hypothetical protein